MNTESIPKKEYIYQNLKERVQNAELYPGDWLIEREVCEHYGISRTPLREVLWRLEKDGLLIQDPGKGFRVRKLSLEEIFEIFQAREAVEGMAAFMVCHQNDEAFFEEITRIRVKLESLEGKAIVEEGSEIGSRMHYFIMEKAGNSLLEEFFLKLKNLYTLTVNLTKKSIDIETRSRDAHVGILKAIEKRDDALAERLIREHLRTTCRSLTEIFYPKLGF